MARPPSKAPQPGKPPSKHSRAARRASSPSINTDKSLKSAHPPAEGKPLGLHHGAGITKRRAKGKRMSHAQRVRQERGMARAEAVVEQLAVKVQRSRDRERVIKGRSTAWEDINEHATVTNKLQPRATQKQKQDVSSATRSSKFPTEEDEDEDFEDVDENGSAEEAEVYMQTVPEPEPAPPTQRLENGGASLTTSHHETETKEQAEKSAPDEVEVW